MPRLLGNAKPRLGRQRIKRLPPQPLFILVAPQAVVEALKLATFSLVRAHMGEISRPVTERGAVCREPRQHVGLTARRSATKHIKNFRPSRLRHSAQRNSSRLGIGGVSMKTAAHYRAMAEECIKWSGEAYTAEVRESYLQLARIWLDTASRLNGLSVGEAAPEDPITAARAAD